MTAEKPLRGMRVLVPRGGPWGHGVAADLRARGASPIVAPTINFAAPADLEPLRQSLAALAAGEYDWLTVTSATTVDVLAGNGVVLAARTRVAAVGETTAAALTASGYRVDYTPKLDNSAAGLLAEWPDATRGAAALRVLTLRSDIARPVLTDGLRRSGHSVDSVVAYRTVGVPVDAAIVQQVAEGGVDAILVTSGSVATQIASQFGAVPERTLVACIGPRTAADARAVGVRVDLVAEERTSASLIAAIEQRAKARG